MSMGGPQAHVKLITNSLGPDSNHTLEKAHPAPVGCEQHTIVTRPRKHCTGDRPNYGKVDRPSTQPGLEARLRNGQIEVRKSDCQVSTEDEEPTTKIKTKSRPKKKQQAKY